MKCMGVAHPILFVLDMRRASHIRVSSSFTVSLSKRASGVSGMALRVFGW